MTAGVDNLQLAQRVRGFFPLLSFSDAQQIATSGVAARSTVINYSVVMLYSSQVAHFAVGNVSVAATTGAGSSTIAANERLFIALDTGQYISVIQDTQAGYVEIVGVLRTV